MIVSYASLPRRRDPEYPAAVTGHKQVAVVVFRDRTYALAHVFKQAIFLADLSGITDSDMIQMPEYQGAGKQMALPLREGVSPVDPEAAWCNGGNVYLDRVGVAWQ
jgi:hypothetical protein